MEVRQDLKYMFRSLGLNELLIIHLHLIEEIFGDTKKGYDFLIIKLNVGELNMELGPELWYSDANPMFSPCCYTESIQKKIIAVVVICIWPH